MVTSVAALPPVVAIDRLTPADLPLVGGKALALAQLRQHGMRVPTGVCVTTAVYRDYLAATGLDQRIELLLGRKEFGTMRWEELWDLALRIRSLFLRTPLPPALQKTLRHGLAEYLAGAVVVRSSAPAEDSACHSFAGLHESFVNVRGAAAVTRSIRLVWASLWSDRALLYRQELGLDVARSAMAVVVQELVVGECSGIAFSRNPGTGGGAMIEAVWGLNQGLVDGTVTPDRWQGAGEGGALLTHTAPQQRQALGCGRGGVRAVKLAREIAARPPLDPSGVTRVLAAVQAAEQLFGRPQDMEWTVAGGELYVLQSRPITTMANDERSWYLTLHRSCANLQQLRHTLEAELLPAMVDAAAQLDRIDLAALDDAALSAEIATRLELLNSWEQRYRDYCIPMAHGIRLFGQYYNDRLQPRDPFQFTELLAATEMLAVKRNGRLEEMAALLRNEPQLAEALRRGHLPDGNRLGQLMGAFHNDYGDLAWVAGGGSPLPGLLLELASQPPRSAAACRDIGQLRDEFLAAVPKGERAIAEELLELARASYRLRDNDNLVLGAINARLQATYTEAARRRAMVPEPLGKAGNGRVGRRLTALPASAAGSTQLAGARRQARQLVGQPAVAGLGHGPARVIARPADLKDFRAGEILVCDAVDPNMTFVVPLAAGIVERRGGMLIHGAIIAREYGIPCVTGIPDATRLICSGDRLTVDGYLGLVIIDTEHRVVSRC
jgi:pyruvate,water dikinase